MCLKQVYEEKPKRTFGIGWKIFVLDGRQLSGSCTTGNYVPNKWYKARYQLGGTNGPGTAFQNKYTYPMGFHIFRFRKDAVLAAKFFREQLRKVRYRGAHTLGVGDHPYKGEQVIANEMMVFTKKESRV
jgi:hypothetical protein